MKLSIIFCIAIVFFFSSCHGKDKSQNSSKVIGYNLMAEGLKSDTILRNIQDKIYNAFVRAIVSGESNRLMMMDNKLGSLYKENPKNLILYWHSYLKFYQSVYYLQNEMEDEAEEAVDTGIEWLRKMDDKNSEDYALLSMLEGFSIQFKGMRAMFISQDVVESAEKAIKMDPNNCRAYYVYGSNDFYRPEKYGGGKEVEKYLLKAISLPDQNIKNDYLPSWGREEAYELLIKYYMRKEKWESAKKYFQKAKTEFPHAYSINQLASELVGK